MKRNDARGNAKRPRLLRPETQEKLLRYLRQNTWLVLFAVLVLVAVILFICVVTGGRPEKETVTFSRGEDAKYKTAYIGIDSAFIDCYDAEGNVSGRVMRGTEVTYTTKDPVDVDDQKCYLAYFDDLQYGYIPRTCLTNNPDDIVSEKTIYVRTPQNLRLSEDGDSLGRLVEQGTELKVLGYDYLSGGFVHLYKVKCGDETGYISGEYTATSLEEATEIYDRFGIYNVHAGRTDRFGGGDGVSLDYYPREKGNFKTEMPDPCYALYMTCHPGVIDDVDKFIEIANQSKINAIVVNIIDGSAVGYPSEVYKEYSPSTYAAAGNSIEEFREAIQKIKDAGLYAIGRLTVFNDSLFVEDHPEYAIAHADGEPLYIAGSYWPSAFCREVWEYKVALAKEAVETMGFDEIQFDYVRFPDGTYHYDESGDIDYHNAYGETKAQAIQRFLMYATDELHDLGVYVGADVFGETNNSYVTSYGQYWAAISNVVDVISGMAYPDHFSQNGTYKPWLHPYETLYDWGVKAVKRQDETPCPAAVRTWIQGYDAIRDPYNVYGPDEVGGEIQGLIDAGLDDGYMLWNADCNPEKLKTLIPAFNEAP